MKEIEILSAVSIHVGKKRRNNEDNFYYNGIFLDQSNREIPVSFSNKKQDKIQIYAVCDGMGGEAAGEEASFIAVKTLEKYQKMISKIKYHDFNKYIDMYISETNDLICDRRKNNENKRIGTTLALLCIENENVHLYNVGDSRIYRLRKGKLIQLSEDHTQAMRLLKIGAISEKDIKTHVHRNKLTQHMGILPEEMKINPTHKSLKVKNKDKYLLCSDGITDVLNDDEILKIMKQDKSEKVIVSQLINTAIAKGSRDDTTAIIVTVNAERNLFDFTLLRKLFHLNKC